MRVFIACCIVVVAGAVAAPAADATTTRLGSTVRLAKAERAMLALINRARTGRGLCRVRVVRSLERAARAHSSDMLNRDYFSHYSSGGASFARRLASFGYPGSGYSGWKVGEVIGWGKGTAGTALSVFRQWMRSAAHRKVILAGVWRNVGVGAKVGTYKGLSGVRMFTVDFGRRTG